MVCTRARRRLRTLVCVLRLIAFASIASFGVSALAQAIPAQLRAAILVRALQYEKGFASRTGGSTLVVLGAGGGSEDAAGMTAAFKQLASSSSSHLTVKMESSTDALKALAPQVIYVARGSESVLPACKALEGVIVLCGDAAAVGKGCVLSVEQAGTSSRLVVDVAEAQRKGLRFDARMLQLSRTLR